MWFKNLHIFAFTMPFNQDSLSLHELLSEVKFVPCGSTEASHTGWVTPLGKHGTSLTHEVSGDILLTLRREEKIVPPHAIKAEVDAKSEAFEVEQGRKPTKKEVLTLREDTLLSLLPRAFSRITDVSAYISKSNNIIVIDTASRANAEFFLALLRKTLGTLPVTSISPEVSPDETMTEWLVEKNIGASFVLGMEAEFKAVGDDAAIARVKNQDLDSDETKSHLDADKYVVKVGLEWDESISFVLNDDLSLKRIKYFDVILENNDDIASDDVLAKLDADILIMIGELNRLINDLAKEFNVDLMSYSSK
jgi:recombination associated protein RdgC